MDHSETFIKMVDCSEIQDSWEPRVGDWIWRKYTVFGEELDKQIWSEDMMQEINVLTFKSSIKGYWHCSNGNGDERIFHSPEEMHKATCIWIPRQDQLQEMLGMRWKELRHFWRVLSSFEWERWSVHPDGRARISHTSYEQMLLAFVMQEKHNKQWEGSKWVCMQEAKVDSSHELGDIQSGR